MIKKRAQLFGMPYSVIFSIFLIVFFIIAAFIAIKTFWCPWCKTECTFSDQSQEGLFKDDLQSAVNDVWNSAGADRPLKINLPSKVEMICFLDYSEDIGKGEKSSLFSGLKNVGKGNVYLYPARYSCSGFKVFTINHINITETTETSNPLCIENGKEIGIKSEHGGLVIIYGK